MAEARHGGKNPAFRGGENLPLLAHLIRTMNALQTAFDARIQAAWSPIWVDLLCGQRPMLCSKTVAL
jgi:hypothetical protein